MGLSKEAFKAASKSSVPFVCPGCRLLKQEHEICELRSAVSKLQSEVMLILQQLPSAKTYATALSRDESSASIVSQASDHSSSNKPILLQTQPMQMTSQVMPQTARFPPRADRKFNLVIHGIKESTKGTSRHIRSSRVVRYAGFWKVVDKARK